MTFKHFVRLDYLFIGTAYSILMRLQKWTCLS
uniref:Uncharacterized protein n=1 Tax=Setaria viridis TaxID=4556 RepID=A0A4U6TYX5_SETVI|nr:hypothetical protein SEVIR_7G279650v2 [Setaria viridis]